MADPQPRRYRFAPPATTGVLLGLDVAQCTFLAAGVIASGLLLRASVPAPIVLTPLAAAGILAFGMVAGVPVRHQLRLLMGWTMARAAGIDRWTAASRRRSSDLPAVLRGIEIDELRLADGRAAGIAIDHTEATVSMLMAVAGGAFTLAERAEQERLLQQWGDAMAPFCVERGLVSSIRWLERSEPTPIGMHGHQVERLSSDAAPHRANALRSCEELVERIEAISTTHTTYVVVTAGQRHAPRPTTGEREHRAIRTARALLEEIMLFTDRLEIAGLRTAGPLGPHELRALWQRCLTPFSSNASRDDASLVELTGRLRAGHLRIDTFRAHRDHVRIDDAVHAAFLVDLWPRLEVTAGWMEPLLATNTGVRTVAVHLEPVPRSTSQRTIDRQSVKLATDEEQRTRTGFRIGAQHRRAQADVLTREAELVAGYAELDYVGVVVVTAADLAGLRNSSARCEQAATQAGLRLRRLDGRHDLGLLLALPTGRGLSQRWFP